MHQHKAPRCNSLALLLASVDLPTTCCIVIHMFSTTSCCIVTTEPLWTLVDFLALCAARSFLHCLSLDYFCALRYALDSHMLNMLCNNISCNVILCYIILCNVCCTTYVVQHKKLESMCTSTSPISV